MPPPDYAYGNYASTKNINSFNDLYSLYQFYQQNTLPLDGFVFDYSMLNNYQSLTYNTSMLSSLNIQNLTAFNMSVIVKSLSGIQINSTLG